MFNWFRRSSKSTAAAPLSKAAARGAVRAPAPAIKATFGDAPAPRPTFAAGSPQSALSPDAQRILAQLPADVSLAVSCARYPHAVEKLLKHWRNPKEFRLALDSMLIDTRGGRQGFPFAVLSEFGRLREHYDLRVAPVKSNAWASIDAR
jgi:hypothetical protein